MATWLEFGSYATDALNDMGTATTLLKKGFRWGKALNPDPGLDFILGALGQGLSDASNPNLSNLQKGGRVVIAGIESMATGWVSNGAGGLGFLGGEFLVPEGGGIVGYLALSIPVSLYLDGKIWVDINHQYLGDLGY